MQARLRDEVRYLQQHKGEAVGLLIVRDADGRNFQQRRTDLIRSLEGLGLRENELDRVAICIPARNVETWKLWLGGHRDLDETGDFKLLRQKEVKALHPRQLVDAWFAALSDSLKRDEERVLPALSHARGEIRRLRALANA